ncbi:MAG: DNA translocase FtsK, partial [Pseudomonadales bacterium]
AYIHFHASSSMPASAGGALGESLGALAINALNVQGSTLLLIALFLFGLTVFTDLSWFKVMDLTGKITLDLIELIQSLANRWWSARVERKQLVAQLREVDERVSEVSAPIVLDRREQAKVKERLIEREESLNKHMSERVNRPAPVITPPAAPKAPEPSKRVLKEKQVNLFEDSALAGSLPPISILDVAEKVQKKYSPEYLEAMSRLLEIKLKEFGVEVIVESVHPGPVITRFEIQPAAGVKVSRISGLAKDLARSMAIISVRVVEVIPGKTTVGIEIPNEDRQIVRFSEVLSSPEYDEAKSPVTLALGHDIGGKPVITDLAKMPHLLVAGTTGSGKSVGVNAMILSILFKSTPEEARLIMIDPKMLELSIYEGIPHLLCPVVTDMKEAANALRWSVAEMERRYKLMSKMGVRNLAGFNRKVKDAEEAGEPLSDPLYKRESMHDEAPLLKTLPTIVVVVDEFADMMMIVGKKVEELIARIAQKARAAGIHLILATQRPSVDVITGLIKANIPTRMAFQVSSKIDSRTILDQGGAEQLLGHGDMLYMPPGTGLPIRVHGAFVSDEEVHRVVEAWKQRGTPDYIDDILAGAEESGSGFEGGSGEGSEGSESDPLYDEAVNFVLESRRASISAVQRKLKIGYNRAARMIEAMEMAGVVTSMNTNGSREVIAPSPVRD